MPYLDLNAPNVRFTVERLNLMQRLTGVVKVDGLNVHEDGTYATMRIFFDSNERMQGYIDGVDRLRAEKPAS